jgi:hypothetical protein
LELRHLPDDQYREQRDDRAIFALTAKILEPGISELIDRFRPSGEKK